RPRFVKVLYRQTASDDIVRQFRYYLLAADAPEIRRSFRGSCQAHHSITNPKSSRGSAVFHLESATSKSSLLAGCWISSHSDLLRSRRGCPPYPARQTRREAHPSK